MVSLHPAADGMFHTRQAGKYSQVASQIGPDLRWLSIQETIDVGNPFKNLRV